MILKRLIFAVLVIVFSVIVTAQNPPFKNPPAQKDNPPTSLDLYKSAVAHLEHIGNAIEAYLTDHALVPRVMAILNLKSFLVPHHIESMEIKDPWGNLYIYEYRYMEKDEYSLICTGSDGRRTSAANDNIVYENGAFSYIPNDKAQALSSSAQQQTPGQKSPGQNTQSQNTQSQNTQSQNAPIISNKTITGPPKSSPADRLKYDTAMNHMRQIGMALDAYSIDNTIYPNVSSIRHLPDFLIPTYTHRLPLSDPWGYDYHYKALGSQGYLLGSGGSDGAFDGFNQAGIYKHLLGQDVVYKNGQFILSPKEK